MVRGWWDGGGTVVSDDGVNRRGSGGTGEELDWKQINGTYAAEWNINDTAAGECGVWVDGGVSIP